MFTSVEMNASRSQGLHKREEVSSLIMQAYAYPLVRLSLMFDWKVSAFIIELLVEQL